MVIKVKEPQPSEYKYFREDLILFTYLHLANEPELTKALLDAKTSAIAYETVQIGNSTPLLRPMSEVAGRRSAIIAATYLEKHRGGQGILLSGTPGCERAEATVVGGGVAGINAAKMLIGLGAHVNILELNEDRIRELDDIFGFDVTIMKSNEYNLAQCIKRSAVVISTILIPGAKAPKIVKEYMVKSMMPGSVIVDISIDQGGSVETIDRITTHDDPVFEKYGVLHYSVANMPGAVARTSTLALTNATMAYAVMLANKGVDKATEDCSELALGLNCYNGKLLNKSVAAALDLPLGII